jgi:hypothetical protein
VLGYQFSLFLFCFFKFLLPLFDKILDIYIIKNRKKEFEKCHNILFYLLLFICKKFEHMLNNVIANKAFLLFLLQQK